MEQIIQQTKSRSQNKQVLIVLQLLILVFALSTMQDFLHSKRNDYPFYISESLLFNTFWILFFPITYLLQRWRSRDAKLFDNGKKIGNIATVIVIGTVLHILLYSSILHILSALFFKQTYLFFINLGYTLANDFYKYPLVYGAISLLLFQQTKTNSELANTDSPQDINQALNKIFIQKGREMIAICTNEIISISSSSPYIAIQTKNKKYLHTETLKSIQDKLDEKLFVRIHKSSIIHIEKVKSYTSRLNGDYDILMQNEEVYRLSRNYVKGFREKMAKRTDH